MSLTTVVFTNKATGEVDGAITVPASAFQDFQAEIACVQGRDQPSQEKRDAALRQLLRYAVGNGYHVVQRASDWTHEQEDRKVARRFRWVRVVQSSARPPSSAPSME